MSPAGTDADPVPAPTRAAARGAGTRARVTLALCTVLHTFTHAYGTMLVPLYLLMAADLRLSGVKEASLVVTAYGVAYSLGSYVAGVLTDRFDRRMLLGWGLIGNAAAILLMGLTRRYEILLALGMVGGAFGTIFHPAANALAPAHFPKSPGMAIGLLGIGSGMGFFIGPQYAGWCADSATWHFGQVANWQRPCVEMGIAGLVWGVAFLLFADEAPDRRERNARRDQEQKSHGPPIPAALRRRVLALACVLAFRDFAGVAGLSLASIFFRKRTVRRRRKRGSASGR